MNETNTLTEVSVRSAMWKIAWPASLGFFFNTMYNVVDTFFGGLQSTEALAALSISFPVFFLIIAFGSGIGSGTTALMGHAIGSGNNSLARHYSDQSFVFMLVLGIVLTGGALLVSPFLFSLLGASGEYLSLSLSYMNVIFYGTIFFFATFFASAVLNSIGDTKTYSKFLIFAFFLNLILDPWFMFGWFGFPALGLAGVAWATVVVQIIGTVYLLYKVVNAGLLNRYIYRDLQPDWKIWSEISKQGFPTILSMMTIAIGIFVITYFISIFGAEGVAAYGIATRIEQIALLPTIGLNIAVLTLVAQNAGAKKFERVREIVKRGVQYNLYILALGAIGIFFFGKLLMMIFTTDASVIEIGSSYLKIAAFIFLSYGILFTYDSFLRGLKKPFPSLIVGLGRQIVAPWIIFSVAIQVLHLGLFGIWWGIFLINWTAAISVYFYSRYVLRRLDLTGENDIN